MMMKVWCSSNEKSRGKKVKSSREELGDDITHSLAGAGMGQLTIIWTEMGS